MAPVVTAPRLQLPAAAKAGHRLTVPAGSAPLQVGALPSSSSAGRDRYHHVDLNYDNIVVTDETAVFMYSPHKQNLRRRCRKEEAALCCGTPRTLASLGLRRTFSAPVLGSAAAAAGGALEVASEPTAASIPAACDDPTKKEANELYHGIRMRVAEQTMRSWVNSLAQRQTLRYGPVVEEGGSARNGGRRALGAEKSKRLAVVDVARNFQLMYGQTLDMMEKHMGLSPPRRRCHSGVDLAAYLGTPQSVAPLVSGQPCCGGQRQQQQQQQQQQGSSTEEEEEDQPVCATRVVSFDLSPDADASDTSDASLVPLPPTTTEATATPLDTVCEDSPLTSKNSSGSSGPQGRVCARSFRVCSSASDLSKFSARHSSSDGGSEGDAKNGCHNSYEALSEAVLEADDEWWISGMTKCDRVGPKPSRSGLFIRHRASEIMKRAFSGRRGAQADSS